MTEIPVDMVEAAAIAAYALDQFPGEAGWVELEDAYRESYRAHVRHILTAALEGCEVRQETAAYVRVPHPSRREKAGDMMPHHPSMAPHTRHVWHGWDPMIRVVITTPWLPNDVEQRDSFGPAVPVEETP